MIVAAVGAWGAGAQQREVGPGLCGVAVLQRGRHALAVQREAHVPQAARAAQAHVGAERELVLVAGLQRELEGSRLLSVEGSLCAQGHLEPQRLWLQVTGHDGIGNLAVGSQV